ncbi:hypothetical protein SS50377_28185 [Spironucleus salmonicida]|uniref:Coiled-coil protein n=1 Tax=Spironucleus salmonicida TaxID=348837 RepID=V6LRQ0_9EUKA|nr:hypothetical protein SS50377_28185 [Spironucleus salmonicida]|eukprot:EST46371.1 hypothetical protein SS50377_13614 [Spironucleus salmonicida]
MAENPELPNAAPPLVNIDADDSNPFLLAPDHYLLLPLQQKLNQQLTDQNNKAHESLRQLLKLEQQLQLRQEDAGVMLHTFQSQLAQAQSKIDELEQNYAQLSAARISIQQTQQTTSETLKLHENNYQALKVAEEELRQQNQRISQEAIEQMQNNTEMKSDAIVRKRSVYRAEEQIKNLEKQKQQQEEFIQLNQDQLKTFQDQETYLTRQLDIQQQETIQANSILNEAQKQMNMIKSDIDQLQINWQLTLNQIEKNSTILKNDLEKELAEYDSTKISMQHSIVSARNEIQKLIEKISKISESIRTKQQIQIGLSEKCENLQSVEINQLLQQLQALKAANDAANARLANVYKEIQQVNKETDQISKENDNQNKILNSNEDAILINNAQQAADSRQLAGLMQELRSLKQAIKECQRDIAKTENEVSKRNLDIVVSEQCVDSLENALEALKAELIDKDKLISSYETQIKKNANAIEQRSSAITRLNKKLEEYSRAHPESDNGPLQAMLNNIGKELNTAGKLMKDTQSTWLRAQTDLVTLSSNYRKELEEIEEKEAQRDLLDRKLKDLEYEKQSNVLKINAINRDIEFLHKDISNMNSKIAEYGKKMVKQNENNYDSETTCIEKIDHIADEVITFQKNLDLAKEEKADCSAQLIEVEEQIMLWQRKINIQYQLMKSVMDNCNSNSGGEISVLEGEIHSLQNDIQLLTKEQKNLVNQLQRGIDIRETITISSQTKMKLDTLNKSGANSKSGASVAREIETINYKLNEKRAELDRVRGELQEAVRRKQGLQASNVEFNGMIEQMRGQGEAM